MKTVPCAECGGRQVDPYTHPAPYTFAHRDYVRLRDASMVPMSMPLRVMGSAGATLTAAQQQARDEVLADRQTPHKTMTVSEAAVALSELRSPAQTQTLFNAEQDRMVARLALLGRGEIEQRSDTNPRIQRAAKAVEALAELERRRSDPDRRDHSVDFIRRPTNAD